MRLGVCGAGDSVTMRLNAFFIRFGSDAPELASGLFTRRGESGKVDADQAGSDRREGTRRIHYVVAAPVTVRSACRRAGARRSRGIPGAERSPRTTGFSRVPGFKEGGLRSGGP